jgi:hypothetical protein
MTGSAASRATVFLSMCLAACGARPELHPLTETCPAHPYVDEFRARRGLAGGAAEVYLEEGGGPALSGYWHSVWVKRRSGGPKRILTAREADPGSGPDVHCSWSRDGQALFIHGSHSGINGNSGRGLLRVIYTLTDDRAWEVPNE